MAARSFTSATLDFLQDLEIRNEREWFQANKDRYETEVREPALRFVADVREPLQQRVSPRLTADDRKVGGSMFRINRDVRFSKDKSPYKTHVGIYFAHELGREVAAPGAYLNLEPGNCFLGCGLYRPGNDVLKALRTTMVEDPDDWIAARDAATQGRWEFGGESLSRAPKGFAADHPLIEDLNRTSCIVSHPLTEKQVTGTGFVDRFVDRIAEARPLLVWICQALSVPF